MKQSRVALSVFVTTLTLFFGFGLAQQTSEGNQPTIKKASIPAVELTYQDQGQGDVVIFVHGAFSDYRVWESQREAVAKSYRFIAPNLRYHGNSPWTDKGATAASKYVLGTFSNDLASLIWQLDVGPVHIVGWSLGGGIALDFAVQYPQLVRSLVLYEPALSSIVSNPEDLETLSKDGEGIGPAFAASQEGNQQKSVQIFAGWVNAQPFDAIQPGWIRTVFRENSRTLSLLFASPLDPPITCAQLGKIEVPVTIVKGQQTRPSFDIVADATRDCIPGSQFVTIPDTRHLGPAENPSAFNKVLLNHLKGNSAKQ